MYTLQDYIFLGSVVIIAMTQVFYVVRTIILDNKLRRFMKLYGELCEDVVDDISTVVNEDDQDLMRSWKNYVVKLKNIF